jgi:hypothetical protein
VREMVSLIPRGHGEGVGAVVRTPGGAPEGRVIRLAWSRP